MLPEHSWIESLDRDERPGLTEKAKGPVVWVQTPADLLLQPGAQHADEFALDGWSALGWDLDNEPSWLNRTRREHCVPFLVDQWPMLNLASHKKCYAGNIIDGAAGILDKPLHVLEDELHLSLNVRRCTPGIGIAGRNYRRDNQVA
jgi:hypothetical protein